MSENCIKEMRKRKGITQIQLAKILGVSQGAVQMVETGQRSLDLDWLNKISEALNCEPWELLPKEMQPNITPEEMDILRAVRKAKQSVIQTADISHTKAG